MGVLSVYHMDIEDFIHAKSYDAGKLVHFNVSVMVDDDFITAVREGKTIWLHHPVYNDEGKIEKNPDKWIYKKEIDARTLWNEIIQKAYDNGEPGIFFYDNLNKDNNLWYIENIVCSNPCAEYLSGTVYGNNPITGESLDSSQFGGACNLGSLFLHNFVIDPFKKTAHLDYEKLKQTIFTGVKMLDNIIDINHFPDPIYENYQKHFRTIGFGFTGLADALVMLNLDYRSNEARQFVFELTEFITRHIYKASIELAKIKGSFPFLDRQKFIQSGFIQKHAAAYPEWEQIQKDILVYGIRNAKMISIAPTGTLSLTFGNNCSSGLEPIFSLEYERKVKMGGQSDDDIKIVKMRDYAYGEWLKVKDDLDTIVTKDKFITALEMTVDEHVEMLRHIAWNVDMSCSKTINVPTEYSFEDTKTLYLNCHDKGIKGCTIFRPNPIRQGIMITDSSKKGGEDNNESQTSLFNIPRGVIIKADDNCIGMKRTLQTGCGTLHCEAFFDPDTGDLLETYLSKGSTGGCNNFMIGLSRMISLSARGGVDIYSIIDQLKSCGVCPSYAVRTATKHDTSKGSCCPMAVGNALLDMYQEIQNNLNEDIYVANAVKDKSDNKETDQKQNLSESAIMTCPQCGEPLSVENGNFQGGCVSCHSCGWSKCE